MSKKKWIYFELGYSTVLICKWRATKKEAIKAVEMAGRTFAIVQENDHEIVFLIF